MKDDIVLVMLAIATGLAIIAPLWIVMYTTP